MLARLPSIFFIMSLLFYYIPKILNKPNKKFIKLHILTGGLSIFLAIVVMIVQMSTVDWIKHIGFALIMILIGLTGLGILKKSSNMRKYHKWSTIGFFGYLLLIIVL